MKGMVPKAAWRCVKNGPEHLGFSLIEFIGVVAILAILAASLVPVVIRRINLAASYKESAGLKAMTDSLTQHILRSNNIPSAFNNAWVNAIAAELTLSSNQIAVTPRGWNRVYLIDPSGWLNTALAAGDWNQMAGGSTFAPTNARVMIVASMSRPLPVSSGIMSSASAFNDIWNTPQDSKPNNPTWSAWAGEGTDLLIQRANLEPLFHRLLLVNGAGGQGYFSINTNSPAVVPPGASGTNSYYLAGTTLRLYDSTAAYPLVEEVIRSDMSRVFEYGIWRDQINVGITNTPPSSLGIGLLAASFFTNAAPVSATFGATPQTFIAVMTSYMNGYSMWAGMDPCFGYSGSAGTYNNGNFPPYELLVNGLDKMKNSVLLP